MIRQNAYLIISSHFSEYIISLYFFPHFRMHILLYYLSFFICQNIHFSILFFHDFLEYIFSLHYISGFVSIHMLFHFFYLSQYFIIIIILPNFSAFEYYCILLYYCPDMSECILDNNNNNNNNQSTTRPTRASARLATTTPYRLHARNRREWTTTSRRTRIACVLLMIYSSTRPRASKCNVKARKSRVVAAWQDHFRPSWFYQTIGFNIQWPWWGLCIAEK